MDYLGLSASGGPLHLRTAYTAVSGAVTYMWRRELGQLVREG